MGWWDSLLERPWLWTVLAIAGTVLLVLPRAGSGPPDWRPGDVATYDLVIPYDVSLPDETATETAREEAREAVLPVYDFEPRLRVELEEQLRMLFVLCRERLNDSVDEIASPRAITELVGTEPMLLVLDNLEHLLEGVGELVLPVRRDPGEREPGGGRVVLPAPEPAALPGRPQSPGGRGGISSPACARMMPISVKSGNRRHASSARTSRASSMSRDAPNRAAPCRS